MLCRHHHSTPNHQPCVPLFASHPIPCNNIPIAADPLVSTLSFPVQQSVHPPLPSAFARSSGRLNDNPRHTQPQPLGNEKSLQQHFGCLLCSYSHPSGLPPFSRMTPHVLPLVLCFSIRTERCINGVTNSPLFYSLLGSLALQLPTPTPTAV